LGSGDFHPKGGSFAQREVRDVLLHAEQAAEIVACPRNKRSEKLLWYLGPVASSVTTW
jgi:hypothetical protein